MMGENGQKHGRIGSLILIMALVVMSVAFPLEGAESLTKSHLGVKFPHPNELVFAPFQFTPPEPERIKLENGMVLYLLEDHELPIVEARAFIRASSDYDPPHKVGLASLTAHVMRTGGTDHMSGDEVDERLEFLAASASVSGFSTLSESLDEVLAVFRDILMHPVFEGEKLELVRQRTLEAIRRENDRPTQVAIREFIKHVAEGHPFSWFPTEETIRNITQKDLIRFHRTFYHPNNLILAVAGDFQREELREKLQIAFAEWEPVEIDFPEVPPLSPESERILYYAPKEIGQSTIIMGHPALRQKDPEFIPFTLMNRILGGSPTGDDRLFREIREKRGLAYAVGSFVSGGQRYRGIFGTYSITRADATGKVIQLLLSELEHIRSGGVTPEELKKTRSALINQFVFQHTSALEIAARAASLEFYHLPGDYYKNYLKRVEEITPGEILQVAREYLRPDEMKIMVVGQKKLFDEDLETFGEVVTIELK
jgi:predicted Zn-dependent peptidase